MTRCSISFFHFEDTFPKERKNRGTFTSNYKLIINLKAPNIVNAILGKKKRMSGKIFTLFSTYTLMG